MSGRQQVVQAPRIDDATLAVPPVAIKWGYLIPSPFDMNLTNHYRCGAEVARANEHNLVGHIALGENIRQAPHRRNDEGASRAHERFHTWFWKFIRVGMIKLKGDVNGIVSHENANKMLNLYVISRIQIWYVIVRFFPDFAVPPCTFTGHRRRVWAQGTG